MRLPGFDVRLFLASGRPVTSVDVARVADDEAEAG